MSKVVELFGRVFSGRLKSALAKDLAALRDHVQREPASR